MNLIPVTAQTLESDAELAAFTKEWDYECDFCSERMDYVLSRSESSRGACLGLCRVCAHVLPAKLYVMLALRMNPQMVMLGGPHALESVRQGIMSNFNKEMADELALIVARSGAEGIKAQFKAFMAVPCTCPACKVEVAAKNGKPVGKVPTDLNEMLQHMGVLPKKKKKKKPTPPTPPVGPDLNV